MIGYNLTDDIGRVTIAVQKKLDLASSRMLDKDRFA
jgi:hypothetical protein